MNEQRHININHETIKRILGVKTPEQAEKMYAEHLEAEAKAAADTEHNINAILDHFGIAPVDSEHFGFKK
jgi:hypothetical protein